MLGLFKSMGKKAGEIITGIGPTPTKQFKKAISDADEDKAIQLYTTLDGDKSLTVELHPSKPFPSKKANQQSETPLHLASKSGLMKLVVLLLHHGGDPSATNSRKETCLHCVCSQSSAPEVRAQLIDTLTAWEAVVLGPDGENMPMDKVSVNQCDIDGNAAIHYAAASGLLGCVEKLVLMGAIISIVNRANITCCEMADEKGHKNLVLMLELALVFQPVDESMRAFDALQSFAYDNVPGKLLLNSCSLTLGGVNDFIEAAVQHVGHVIGGDLKEHKNRTEALLESMQWNVDALIAQYIEDPLKVLATAKLADISGFESSTSSNNNNSSTSSSSGNNTTAKDASAKAKPFYGFRQEFAPPLPPVEHLSTTVEDSSEASPAVTSTTESDNYKAAVDVSANSNNVDNSHDSVDNSNINNTTKDSEEKEEKVLETDSLSDVSRKSREIETAHLSALLSSAHLDFTTEGEACAVCGDNMLKPVDVSHFVKGDVLEPDRRELRCLSGHSFCVGCWSSHLAVQVGEKGLGCMPCPGYKCGEILDLQWAPVMLKNQDLVNRMLLQRQRHVVDLAGLKTCPIETCGLFVCIPCAPTESPSSNRKKAHKIVIIDHDIPLAVVCGNGHSFCLSCSQSAHSPLSCANFPVWYQQVKEETKNTEIKEGTSGDDIANALWVAANTKRCPRCSTPIEKDEGCNHMCCRKCRKEFCWICMQDWSQHSDTTGGYFQCNRFKDVANSEGEVDVFAEEKGSAIAETMRLRYKNARMARFIHYFTRFQAHGDSMKMEGRMQKETLPRITEGLRASRDGSLHWLQEGNGVLNPLVTQDELLIPLATHDKAYPVSGDNENDRHAKSDRNGNNSASNNNSSNNKSSSSNSSSVGIAMPPMPSAVTRHVSKSISSGNRPAHVAKLEAHCVKNESCLLFLSDGFDELLKCRDILQWSYPYAYFEFEERGQNDYGGAAYIPMTRFARARQYDHRTSFELLQSDLEQMVETLSDVVARRRLRAGQSQIEIAARAAKSKRIELESLIINYNIGKSDGSGPNSAYHTPTRAPRSSDQRSRARNNTARTDTSRQSDIRQQQRNIRQQDSNDSIDLAQLLLELDLAGAGLMMADSAGGSRSDTPQESASAARIRGQEQLQALIAEMLGGPPASSSASQPSNLFPPAVTSEQGNNSSSSSSSAQQHHATPERTTNASEQASSSTGERSGERRHRREKGGERSAERTTGSSSGHKSKHRHHRPRPSTDVVNANNSPMLFSSLPRPPEPPRRRRTPAPDETADGSNNADNNSPLSSNSRGDSSVVDELQREEGEESDEEGEDAAELANALDNVYTGVSEHTTSADASNSSSSSVGNNNSSNSNADRVARSVATEMRLARLTRRAEEETELNRAILMSLQDNGTTAAAAGVSDSTQSESDIEQLMSMGFERDAAVQALRETRNNVELAANRLLGL